mmetsp:Transcript_26991/g.62715  ORF Transcript_26991/g.62715 Transcript_26991/m.62715 type:complete len:100 (-) Transcript_26991:292-591(-)
MFVFLKMDVTDLLPMIQRRMGSAEILGLVMLLDILASKEFFGLAIMKSLPALFSGVPVQQQVAIPNLSTLCLCRWNWISHRCKMFGSSSQELVLLAATP